MAPRAKAPTQAKLGIDFGTSRTVVAACDRGNYPVTSFEGPGGEAVEWYPSVLAARGDELRAGLEAMELAADPSWELLPSFKRLLSVPGAAGREVLSLGGRRLSVQEALTRFLITLKADLGRRSNLGLKASANQRLECMVAVPANAHSTQRFITLAAFRDAGFEVKGMLNEPSAAGFEYAHRHRATITGKREQIAVYDLGGGTFDASLVQMSGRAHQVLATRGVSQLGGDDFDQLLLELALRAAKVDGATLSRAARIRLLQHCRELKEGLHPNTRRIVIELAACIGERPGVPDEVSVPVEAFYEACSPLIDQTLAVLGEVATDELAGIYVVGGASALPAIARTLKERFGRRVHRSPYPSAAAAIGLAIALDEEAGFKLEDRFSRVFGVFREASAGQEIAFDPLLAADFALPIGGAAAILERSYRAAHNIGYFRYVEASGLDASGSPSGDVTPFGELLFPFDPALRSGRIELDQVRVARIESEGPRVRERYRIDANGLVELTITDLENGYERQVQVRT